MSTVSEWLLEHNNMGLATHTYMRELETLCAKQHEALEFYMEFFGVRSDKHLPDGAGLDALEAVQAAEAFKEKYS